MCVMSHKLVQCSSIIPLRHGDSLVPVLYKAMLWDSSGAKFAFTSAQSAQDNLPAVCWAPHGWTPVTHDSTANFPIRSTLFICLFLKHLHLIFFASFHIHQKYFEVHPFVYKSVCYCTYSGSESRSDHVCSASVPRATVRVIMSLTTHGVGVFLFLYVGVLRASPSVVMPDVTVCSARPAVMPLLI